MTKTFDLLSQATKKRLTGYSRDIVLNAIFAVFSVLFGGALFIFLSLNGQIFGEGFTLLLSQIGTTLFGAGISGVFFNKVLTLRSEMREGREWIDLYENAMGPPPDDLVGDIQQKILGWLEG